MNKLPQSVFTQLTRKLPHAIVQELCSDIDIQSSLGSIRLTVEDFVQIVNENPKSVDDVKRLLKIECELCNENACKLKMFSLVSCKCEYCIECSVKHFKERVRNYPPVSWSCPLCCQPSLEGLSRQGNDAVVIKELELNAHLQYLQLVVEKNQSFEDIKELMSWKLTSWNLSKDPNFLWCAHNCGNGMIFDGKSRCVFCRVCNKSTCRECRNKWERAHENKTCEEFEAWKIQQNPTIAKISKIICPKCRYPYELVRGGCLHFTCHQCRYEFCGGCNEPVYNKTSCPLKCNKGLHSHCPRNCFFFLRDWNTKDLEDFLRDSDVNFKGNDQETKSSSSTIRQCTVMLAESDKSEEKPCAEDCYKIGLCERHYKEYLSDFINRNKLDPAMKMTVHELTTTMQREKLPVPEKQMSENEADYCKRLLQQLQRKKPIKKLTGGGMFKQNEEKKFECEICHEDNVTLFEPLNKTSSPCNCHVCTTCYWLNMEQTIMRLPAAKWKCGVCGLPNNAKNSDQLFDVWREFLNGNVVKTLLSSDVESVRNNFENKVCQFTLSKTPGGVCCFTCKIIWVEVNKKKVKVQCPKCNLIFCRTCNEKWRKEHEGVTCEEMHFLHMKDAGKEIIRCPKCLFLMEKVQGNCEHFDCFKCATSFCPCGAIFYRGNECEIYGEQCSQLGFHAHHASKCYCILRNMELDDLRRLVSTNGLSYARDSNSQRCTASEGFNDHLCDLPSIEFGLCKKHLKYHLSLIIQNNNLNPEDLSVIHFDLTKTALAKEIEGDLTVKCGICLKDDPRLLFIKSSPCNCQLCATCYWQHMENNIINQPAVNWKCGVCKQSDDIKQTGDRRLFLESWREFLNGNLAKRLSQQVDDVRKNFEIKTRQFTLSKTPGVVCCLTYKNIRTIDNQKRFDFECANCGLIICRSWNNDQESVEQENVYYRFLGMSDTHNIRCPKCPSFIGKLKDHREHFDCRNCSTPFCSCGAQFYQGKECEIFGEKCTSMGFHAHHLRNCYTLLKNMELNELGQLVTQNGLSYARDGESSVKCSAMDGFDKQICNLPSVEFGLCNSHLINHLSVIIQKNHLDPVDLWSSEKLKGFFSQKDLGQPQQRRASETENDYRKRIAAELKSKWPLQCFIPPGK